MHPILLKTSWLTIHTYGFLIATGFLVCILLMRRKAKKLNINPDSVTDIALWTMVTGLIGARTLYVITRWDEYMQRPQALWKFWEGGLVFYGGFLTGFCVFVWLTKRYKLNVFDITDLTVPSVAIAHFFGRWGCFMAGCCYGRVATPSFPFSVVFTDPESIAPLNIHLHPAQLYDAFNNLLIFIFLQWFYPRRRFSGQLTCLYIGLYAIGRAFVESFRGDQIRGFVIGSWLSTSQFIGAILLCLSILGYFRLRYLKNIQGAP